MCKERVFEIHSSGGEKRQKKGQCALLNFGGKERRKKRVKNLGTSKTEKKEPQDERTHNPSTTI